MDPTSTSDPFDLLGLPRSFEIEPAALRKAWLAASGAGHPDRAGADPLEEAEIARKSALCNAAKRTLEDPERRAEALVTLLGGPSKEQDKSLPDGFLMEMMEVREDLEAAEGDPSHTAELERWAQAQRQGHIDRIGAHFGAYEQSRDPETLTAIRAELNAWRYIERMLEQFHPNPGARG